MKVRTHPTIGSYRPAFYYLGDNTIEAFGLADDVFYVEGDKYEFAKAVVERTLELQDTPLKSVEYDEANDIRVLHFV